MCSRQAAVSSSDVQWAHRVAAMAMPDLQNGQSLVAGAAAAASSFFLSLLIHRTMKKMHRATSRKLTMLLTSKPQAMTAAPASLAAASVSYGAAVAPSFTTTK